MEKNKLRRVLSIFLSIMFVCAFMPLQIFAVDAVISVTGASEINAGEENTFAVKLTGNPGFAGFTIKVVYDASKFEFVSASKGTYASNIDLPSSNSNGTLIISAANSDNLTGDGTLANINLKAKSGASGGTTVSVTVDELFNEDLDDIAVTVTNATVNVHCHVY